MAVSSRGRKRRPLRLTAALYAQNPLRSDDPRRGGVAKATRLFDAAGGRAFSVKSGELYKNRAPDSAAGQIGVWSIFFAKDVVASSAGRAAVILPGGRPKALCGSSNPVQIDRVHAIT